MAEIPSMTRTDVNWGIVLAVSIAVALAIGWVGFIASDDALYFRGAMRWIDNPPFAGDDHWTTRFPVVLSLALSTSLIGPNFAAFAGVALMWYAITVALMAHLASRAGGRLAGWIAALLTAVTPVVVVNASIVNCDLPEAALLMLGIVLLTCSAIRGNAFAAGVAFGAGVLARETALLSLLGFIPLFLIGKPFTRRTLIFAAIGGAAVLGGECLFQWLMTGNALNRYELAYNHSPPLDRAIGGEGNLLVHPAIDPLLVLLVNNEFGLLFWLLPLAAWGARAYIARPPVAALTAIGLANFIFVAALSQKLVLNPRYFTVAALAAIVLVAVWFAGLGPRWRSVLLTATVAAALGLLSLGNAHPRWDVEALVQAARANPGRVIVTDRETLARAEYPLRFAQAPNVVARRPIAGDLVLAAERPTPDAVRLASYPTPPRAAGAILSRLGLLDALPTTLAGRLESTGSPINLWQSKR